MATEVERATLRGETPTAGEFATSMTRAAIALRVGDRICAAHPQWMTRDQAREVARQLTEVCDD